MNEKKSSNDYDLTSGNVGTVLFRLAWPMALAIVANMSFNLVDTYFVGQLGVVHLTAISFSFPVVILLLNLAIGLSIGITSVLSRDIGKGNTSQVKHTATQVLVLSVALASVIAFFGIILIEPTFRVLGATESSMPFIKDYMPWAYGAMSFRMVSIALSGVFKAYGITKVPSFAIITTAIINLILDPILIFGLFGFPKLGIEGAGIATFISNFIAMCLEFSLAAFVYKFLGNLSESFLQGYSKLMSIIKISLPASFGNALNPLSLSLGNYLLAKESPALVAGFGVATKLQLFSMVPVLALSAGLGSVVGQNFGNGKDERVKKTVLLSFGFCVFLGALQSLLFLIFSEQLSALFTDETKSILFSKNYLTVVSFSLVGYSFVIIAASALNAIDNALRAFVLVALRSILFFMSFYYAFTLMELTSPIIWAYFWTNIFAGLCSIFLVKKLIAR